MVKTLRNIAALKIKGTGSIAPGGIYSTGIMNDGSWAGGGFRITNTTGANTGDLGISASLVAGTAQGFVISPNALYCLVRSNNSGWQTGILKKAAAIGNFGASISNLHTMLGLGSNMFMTAGAWMPDNRHFWITGPTTNNAASGQGLMWLCRYDPDTNTVVLVDTYNAGGEITQMILSPDKQRLLCLDGSVTSNGFFVLRLTTGYKIASRVGVTGSTASPNPAFWHPRLNMFGWTNFNSAGSMIVVRWNGSSYVSVTTPVPGALTRGGGFLFSGEILWCIQGTTLRLYDVSTDGLTIVANTTITPPTVIATTTVLPRYRAYDDNATMGMFTTANGAYILTSNDLAVRPDITFPNLAFAGSVGVEAAGELHPVFPKLQAEFSARRNEYFALTANFPKLNAAAEVVNLYANVEAVMPKPVFASTVYVLDEPYEPYTSVYRLGLGAISLTAEAGSATSEDAGQFVYTLGWDFPLLQAEILGGQGVEANGDFITPTLTGAFTAGIVPQFTGDFVTPQTQFSGLAAILSQIDLDAVFPLMEADFAGTVQGDVAILEAEFPTLEVDIEAEWLPGAFVEVVFPVAEFAADVTVPFAGLLEATLPTVEFEADVNVPLGVLIDAEYKLMEADVFVNVPNPATVDAVFPNVSFDGYVEVPYAMDLEAVTPVMQADVGVIFKYAADLGATFPLLEFAALPPMPVDVDLDAQFIKMEADVFGGPVPQIDFNPEFPAMSFVGAMIMGPRIDANFRMPKKMEAEIIAKFILTGRLEAVFPLLQADLFGGNIVKGDLDAQFPNLLYKGIVRVGDQPTGDGSPFQLSYHKMSKRQKIFRPIRMPPS